MAIAFWTVFSFLVILTIVSAIVTNEFVKRSFDKKVDQNAREEFANVIVKSFYDVKGKDIKSIGLQDLHWRAPIFPLSATNDSFVAEVQPSSLSDRSIKNGKVVDEDLSFAQSELSEDDGVLADISRSGSISRSSSKLSRNALARRNAMKISSSLDEIDDPENLGSQQQLRD